VLKLFVPEEVELLICGNNDDPDFRDLEKVTLYEGGFTRDHPTIQNFWGVVHSMSLNQKKAFLSFCTGTDRIPLRGLSSIIFTIQKNGVDSDRLPTASTCFSVLLLPAYETKQKLQEKLELAIGGAEGFGLK